MCREERRIYYTRVLSLSVFIGVFVSIFILHFLGVGSTRNDELIKATVIRVIDGDTIVVSCVSNDERVRLIGVDAPEMGFFGGIYEKGATEATEFVREMLPYGQVIWLERKGADRDRFGRLRRYVWLEKPINTNDERERENKTLNRMLINKGHAVAWP